MRQAAGLLIAAVLAACTPAADAGRDPRDRAFPRADRPVSNVVSNQFSNEAARERVQEAATVMDLAGIGPGMSVADIGAGEGYYTVRVAARVGEKGRVLAQDIDDGALRRLGERVERDRLDNVSIIRGGLSDPRLPEASFDRVLMIHMVHEVREPYAFLWRLWPSLKPGGQVVVVDLDRPTDRHGIPPALLQCEFEASGFRLLEIARKPPISGYLARFAVGAMRPEPASIKACSADRGEPARG